MQQQKNQSNQQQQQQSSNTAAYSSRKKQQQQQHSSRTAAETKATAAATGQQHNSNTAGNKRNSSSNNNCKNSNGIKKLKLQHLCRHLCFFTYPMLLDKCPASAIEVHSTYLHISCFGSFFFNEAVSAKYEIAEETQSYKKCICCNASNMVRHFEVHKSYMTIYDHTVIHMTI